MNHQERLELLSALVRAGVSHYKSHELEIHFEAPAEPQGLEAWLPRGAEKSAQPQAPVVPPVQNDQATEKLKDLIVTLKMDDASLIDKIFPAGAEG